jgi:hypothetical protein
MPDPAAPLFKTLSISYSCEGYQKLAPVFQIETPHYGN